LVCSIPGQEKKPLYKKRLLITLFNYFLAFFTANKVAAPQAAADNAIAENATTLSEPVLGETGAVSFFTGDSGAAVAASVVATGLLTETAKAGTALKAMIITATIAVINFFIGISSVF
jgi:hypothetical protein